MLEAPRSRRKTEPGTILKPSLDPRVPNGVTTNVEKWDMMVNWMKDRMKGESKIKLADKDIPFIRAMLGRGNIELLHRASAEGKHTNLEVNSGYNTSLKTQPLLLNAMRESLIEYFMTTESLDSSIAYCELDSRDFPPNLVLTGLAKKLVEKNEHYKKYAEHIPHKISESGAVALRVVISFADPSINTVISCHPRDNTDLATDILN